MGSNYQAFMPMACGFFLTLLLSSCEQKSQEKKFFDIPGYFHSQVDYIKSSYKILRKTVRYNGVESKTKSKVVDVNWENEFALFIQCDLNKPVYYVNAEKSGSDDSTGTGNEEYEMNSNSTPIKRVVIRKHNSIPFLISIKLEKENLISSTKTELFYNTLHVPFFVDSPETEILYSIKGEQVIRGLNQTNSFEIVGIICNRE